MLPEKDGCLGAGHQCTGDLHLAAGLRHRAAGAWETAFWHLLSSTINNRAVVGCKLWLSIMCRCFCSGAPHLQLFKACQSSCSVDSS